MKTASTLLALATLLTLSSPGWAAGDHAGGHHDGPSRIGEPGKAARATRTVQVTMNDAMRFVPDRLAVRRGETVRFVVRNHGQLKHEFVLGTEADLNAHYEQMKRFPAMEHDDPSMVTVPPGETRELTWRFSQPGTVHIGCLQVGHYDAGMKGRIEVSKPRSK